MINLAKIMFPVLFAVLFLVSCGQQPVSSVVTSTASENQTQPEKPAQVLNASLALVTESSGLMFTSLAPGEDGFYHIITHTDGTGNILYSDYASGETVYLSSQVSSQHNTAEDESFLTSCIGGVVPGYDGKQLYVLRLGKPQLAQLYGQDGQALLLQMDTNGSNRKEFYLPANMSFMPGTAVASDQTALYTILREVTENSEQFLLCKIDIASKTITTLETLPSAQNHFVIGAVNDFLILKGVSQLSTSPLETDYNTKLNQLKHELYLYNVAEGSKTTLATWKQGEYTEAIAGNYIYLYQSQSNTIQRVDCLTLQKQALPTLKVPAEFEKSVIQLEQDVWDNKLLFYSSDETTRARFSYDLTTGETAPLTLELQDTPLQIYAQTETSFLVRSDEIVVPFEEIASDGTILQSKRYVSQYALVAKNDFWHNSVAYQKIKVLPE